MNIFKKLISGAALFALVMSAALANTPPSMVNAISTNDGVAVSWSDSGATSYRVYRELRTGGTIFNSAIEIQANIFGFDFLDTSAVTGEVYKYFIIACNDDQACGLPSPAVEVGFNGFGSGSNAGNDNGAQCDVMGGSTGNSIPTNVALDVSTSPARLTWVPPSGSVRWNVYRNDVYEFTVTNGTPAYDVENHINGNEYYVTAIFPDGSISWRSEIATENSTSNTNDVDVIALQSERDQLAVDLQAANDLIAQLQSSTGTVDDALLAERDALLVSNAGLEVAVQSAESERDTALADLTIIQADLTTAETELVTVQTELATAQSDLATAQAELATCQTDLTTTTDAALIVANDLASCQAVLP